MTRTERIPGLSTIQSEVPLLEGEGPVRGISTAL